MTSDQKRSLERAYAARFTGWEDLAIDELRYQDHFWDLVAMAIERGRALTRAELEAAFPDAAWDF